MTPKPSELDDLLPVEEAKSHTSHTFKENFCSLVTKILPTSVGRHHVMGAEMPKSLENYCQGKSARVVGKPSLGLMPHPISVHIGIDI